MSKWTLKVIAWSLVLLIVAMVFWIVARTYPISLTHFDPGQVVIADSVEGDAPNLTWIYRVKMDFVGSRAGAIHKVSSAGQKGGPVVEFTSSQRRYLPNGTWDDNLQKTIDATREMNLCEWTNDYRGCASLKPGSYFVDTCFWVHWPILNVFPPRHICRRSNVFTVFPLGDGETEG